MIGRFPVWFLGVKMSVWSFTPSRMETMTSRLSNAAAGSAGVWALRALTGTIRARPMWRIRWSSIAGLWSTVLVYQLQTRKVPIRAGYVESVMVAADLQPRVPGRSAPSWRGQVECVAPGRGALGSGGHRSPRSSQRAPGSVLRKWLGPVVSHCSLEAACAERPALDGIQPDKDTARRHDALSIGQRAACPRLTVAEARGPVG